MVPGILKPKETQPSFLGIQEGASLTVWMDAFDPRQGHPIASFLGEAFNPFGLSRLLQMAKLWRFRGGLNLPAPSPG